MKVQYRKFCYTKLSFKTKLCLQPLDCVMTSSHLKTFITPFVPENDKISDSYFNTRCCLETTVRKSKRKNCGTVHKQGIQEWYMIKVHQYCSQLSLFFSNCQSAANIFEKKNTKTNRQNLKNEEKGLDANFFQQKNRVTDILKHFSL